MVALAATLLLPFAAADSSPLAAAAAAIDFAALEGSGSARTEPRALLVGPGNGTFGWVLTAKWVAIDWRLEERMETTKPTSFRDRQFWVVTAFRAGRDSFENVSIRSTGNLVGSQAAIKVDHAEYALAARSSDLWLRPAEGDSVGLVMDVDLGLRAGALPPGMAEMSVEGGTHRVHGDFTIDVWAANVSVTDDGETHIFQTGNWTKAVGPSVGGRSLARANYSQALRLTAVDAVLEIVSSGRPVSVVGPALTLEGDFQGSFANVAGSLRLGSVLQPLQSTSLGLRGVRTITAWNSSSTGPALSARIIAPASSWPVEWELVDPSVTETRLAEDAGSRGPFAGASVVALAGALALVTAKGLRDRRRVALDEIEWALFQRRPRRAAALARRRLRRHPRDPDAAFLLGAAYLALDRPDAILRELRPHVAGSSRSDQSGIRLLLSRAEEQLRRLRDSSRGLERTPTADATRESLIEPTPYIA